MTSKRHNHKITAHVDILGQGTFGFHENASGQTYQIILVCLSGLIMVVMMMMMMMTMIMTIFIFTCITSHYYTIIL
jgi:hypothetical protein